jgi:hypothetical protein
VAGATGATGATGVTGATGPGGSSTYTLSGKTAAYTVVAGDLGTVINCTANSFTVSLTAAATLGSGFNCWIWNTGTGAITIDPDGSETIDGSTTIILRRSEGTQIVCDGTNWQTGGKKTMRRYAENSASNVRAVASGTNSFAISGTASATDSFALSGNATALGAGALYGTANGQYSVAIFGTANNTAAISAYTDYYLGTSQCTGQATFVLGNASLATERFAIAMGTGASADKWGKFALSSNRFGGAGDSQFGLMVMRVSTSGTTPGNLSSANGNSGPGTLAQGQPTLQNGGAFAFTGTVVARVAPASGTASAAWEIKGLIRRETTAASTVLVASTVTVIDNTPGWTLALSADTTNGALTITGTGGAGQTVRWVATVLTSEVAA